MNLSNDSSRIFLSTIVKYYTKSTVFMLDPAKPFEPFKKELTFYEYHIFI
jgi:hypothetical protein